MKIGEYLKKRREAAGLTIEQLCTNGPGKAAAIAMMSDLEAGLIEATENHIYQLWQIIAFCPDTAMAILKGKDVRICKSCGCSWKDACVDEHGHTCHWVAMDRCSHCDFQEAA